MRQPALLFILKGEMGWHRNSRQAPWKLSSTDANRPNRFSEAAAASLNDINFSVQKYALVWTIQRERRYFNIKTLSVVSLHLISPAHHPRWRV